MSDLFKGLEELGFSDVKGFDLYKKEEDAKKVDAKKAEESKPENFIYKKGYVCPCCYKEFSTYAVRPSKLKFVRSDTDFRNYFEPYDPLYYDAILCPICGYCATSGYFKSVTEKQMDLIKEKITSRFKGKEYPMIYSTENAIERFKFALLNAVVKNAKNSEKANICLKISWLYRDCDDKKNELYFSKHALEGFVLALAKEFPPICGMDEYSATYLIGDLYRRTGDYSEAMKWIGRIVTDRGVKKNLKDKAIYVKDLIYEKKSK